MTHGKATTYTNHGCRCDRCRRAWNRAQAIRQWNRHHRMLLGQAAPEHGRPSTYHGWRCRCTPCRASVRRAA